MNTSCYMWFLSTSGSSVNFHHLVLTYDHWEWQVKSSLSGLDRTNFLMVKKLAQRYKILGTRSWWVSGWWVLPSLTHRIGHNWWQCSHGVKWKQRTRKSRATGTQHTGSSQQRLRPCSTEAWAHQTSLALSSVPLHFCVWCTMEQSLLF